MSSTGTAAVFTGTREPFDLREFPVPDPGPRDMVIRIERTNVCGTDLHVWRGDTDLSAMGIQHGIILGHETVGRVHKRGEKVRTDALGQPLKEGDRVVFTYYIACGQCKACMRGDEHMCMMSLATPIRSCDRAPHFLGGFGEYYYLKGRQNAFKLPDTVSDAAAAGANCALSQVLYGLDVVGGCSGQAVVVQGAGGLGLYACAAAKDQGADLVIAVDLIAERLELARRFGADEVIDAGAMDDPRARVAMVQSLTGNWGADLVVEVAGVPAVVPEGIRMLGRGGRYLEIGNVNPRHTFKADPSLLTGFNRSIHGVSLYRPRDLYAAVRFLDRARDRYPFDELVSHTFKLGEITDAFAAADPHGERPTEITRAAITMDR